MEKAGLLFKHYSIIMLVLLFTACLCRAGTTDTEYYKILSSIEYTGQEQFKHQVETQLKVEKLPLSDNQVRYTISSQDINFSASAPNEYSSELSFLIDKNSNQIVANNRSLSLIENIHNKCLSSVQKIAQEDIDTTWKQSFELSSLNYSLPEKMTFTLTAMQVETQKYGQMTAVRALSEPFPIKTVTADGNFKTIHSRMNSIYLFDSAIETVFLSISVFEASADIAAVGEKFRYEVATYKTDINGTSIDLAGLDENFEKFTRKVGLTSKTINVSEPALLPAWVQEKGLLGVQAAEISAAVACEGSLNPVISISFPAVTIAQLQSLNNIASAGQITSIGAVLAQNIPAISGMKIAAAPVAAGIGLQGAGIIAGVGAGSVAIAGGFDSDGRDHLSPSIP